jgi:hypothetical protein
LVEIQPSIVMGATVGVLDAFSVDTMPMDGGAFYMVANMTWGSARQLVSGGSTDTSSIYQAFTPSTEYATAFEAAMPELLSAARAAPGFGGGAIRLATITSTSPSIDWSPVEQGAINGLTFNGPSDTTPATSPSNAPYFLEANYNVSDPASQASTVSQLVQFAPNIILLLGGSDVVQLILPGVEAGWQGGNPLPIYYGHTTMADSVVAQFLQGSASLQQRLGYFFPVAENETFAGIPQQGLYVSRMAEAFPGSSPPPQTLESYDMFYAMMYAIVAAGPPAKGGNVRGPDVANGLALLQTGPASNTFWTGLPFLTDVIAALVNGSIRLQGISNTLAFDASSGYVPTNIWGACWTSNLSTFPSNSAIDGLVFVNNPNSTIWNYQSNVITPGPLVGPCWTN